MRPLYELLENVLLGAVTGLVLLGVYHLVLLVLHSLGLGLMDRCR